MNAWSYRKSLVVMVTLTLCASAVLAGFSGTDLFLPMAGRQAGVHPSNWYTTVWVHNPGAEAATARIYFLERGTANPAPPWVDVLVGPGATEKLENVVEAYFHEQAFGALRVTCATEKLVVTSRVYSQAAGEGESASVGQDFTGVPVSFAIGVGEKSQILGAYQTVPTAGSEHRYNFGVVETAGRSAWVRFRAVDAAGAELGRSEFQVREWSQRQVAFKDHFPGVSTENARLEVEVISGEGKVIAYGSQIANGSQDPTTFEMTYAEQAQGVVAVQHDATLVGDGTAAAPLGLADGAVTAAELAPAAVTAEKLAPAAITTDKIAPAASAGQVLVTRNEHGVSRGDMAGLGLAGGSVAWMSPGLLSLGLSPGGVTFGGPAGALAQDPPNLFWDDEKNRLGIGTAEPAEQLTLTGNLKLPETTVTSGQLLVGGDRFMHEFGAGSTFLGKGAGNLTLTGQDSTGAGAGALNALTSGNYNSAFGAAALGALTSGSSNVALGRQAAGATTSGHANVAIGAHALESNLTGGNNTVIGYDALAVGQPGNDNVAVGRSSMLHTTGSNNVALGSSSLPVNTSGMRNTALGHAALYTNTTGSDNIGIGREAGRNFTTGSWNIAIGHGGVAGESGTIRLGFSANHTRAFIAGIYGTTTGSPTALPVVVDHLGQLGTTPSSSRFKQRVADIGDASLSILALRPVTYELIQHPGVTRYGLIAEEVLQVMPELVAVGADGLPAAVLYDELPALLLNELQRQQRTIDELRELVSSLEREVTDLRDGGAPTR
jgi:hypothetical protein